ncbi:MAG TPA: XdhC family protein [Candidatus Nanopelagicaceae bacterium]|nr:XdhC family protein [Candidatus Nanopelagicaceae bacterium]
MYGVALSVNACLRAKTRADVAWIVSTNGLEAADRSDAVALTPGGGRIGSLLSGVLDGSLTDLASRHTSTGRVVEIQVTETESLIAGLPNGGSARCVLIPASELPTDLWPMLLSREAICLVSSTHDDVILRTDLYSSNNISEADLDVAELFNKGVSTCTELANRIVTILWPVTKLVIAGEGPIVDALRNGARLLGWQVAADSRVQTATGLMVGLTKIDCAVIMGHDVESSSRSLAAALESQVGYIGALGSRKMQENRADWLAYRGVTDLTRVHGPAGLAIGAKTPAEIGISILAEAIAVQKGLRDLE